VANWLELKEPASFEDRRITALREARRSLNTFIRWNLKRAQKEVFCDKSLPNVDNVRLLLELYPRAKFICVYRNSMDMIASCVEACKWGYQAYGLQSYIATNLENFVAGIARAWCERTEIISLVEEALPAQCRSVRYETLVTDPLGVAHDLCTFLEVVPDDTMTEAALEREHVGGHGDHKVLDTWSISLASLGRGSAVPISLLSDPALANMNRVLAKVGYLEVDRSWNSSPSPYRRGLATPGDYLVIQSLFQGHIQSVLRSLPLGVGSDGFTVRVIVEECAGPESWVIDLGQRRVYLDTGTAETHSVLIARASALCAVAAGLAELADLHSTGDIRDGTTERYANSQGLRLVGLALTGHDREANRHKGAFASAVRAAPRIGV
jgi:hypothetical protein